MFYMTKLILRQKFIISREFIKKKKYITFIPNAKKLLDPRSRVGAAY